MSKVPKGKYKSFRDMILEEYEKGNVVFATVEGYATCPIEKFIKQPIEGILYDLNRYEATVLTWIKDQKWVNDFAVAKVIRKLKEELDKACLKATKEK
jgi:hypothetical protein